LIQKIIIPGLLIALVLITAISFTTIYDQQIRIDQLTPIDDYHYLPPSPDYSEEIEI